MENLFAAAVSNASGGAIVTYAMNCLIRAIRSVHWPRTTGVITEVAMRSARGVDGDILNGFDLVEANRISGVFWR
jgi:hypothetical protein